VGEKVTVPCFTSPGRSGIWWHQDNPRVSIKDVYNVRGEVLNGYKRSGRFSLRKDSDSGDYSLVIENITLSDAGLYTCVIDDGYGDYYITRVIVSGRYIIHSGESREGVVIAVA